ncbi:MAG: tetratricopeptide repeat protein [Deltaproteobacteria bacterium]|nr:tetratricopeptide repeat protein [Deltaproteobacteria bacterium]
MILSGTVLGLVGVFALLMAALILALLDKRERERDKNVPRSRFLSKMALVLFLAAFVGGVLVTLIGGIKPREDQTSMGSTPPMAPAIGQVDEEEFKKLQQMVLEDPKNIKARERLGHLYLQQQDFENVFRMAHEALQINPKSVESLVHMGMVLFAMQKPDDAMNQFDKALAIDPKNQEALRFKGMVESASSIKN